MSVTIDHDDVDIGEPLVGGHGNWDDGIAGTSGGPRRSVEPTTLNVTATGNQFSPEVTRAIEGVKFIAEHLKKEDEARYVSFNDFIKILHLNDTCFGVV